MPPLFPSELLTAVLTTLFTHFQTPSVTLLSAPAMVVVAAGLRSGLVVDIGWAETVVTPVYDLHPLDGRGLGVHGRSCRGIRLLRDQWHRLLAARLPGVALHTAFVEALMERLGHVSRGDGGGGGGNSGGGGGGDSGGGGGGDGHSHDDADDDDDVAIPIGGRTLLLPFSALAEPAQLTFFAPSTSSSGDPDDDDTPLPLLLYNALLRCPTDVRAACLSRIIFVGGGAEIPGLSARVLAELRLLVRRRGWLPCRPSRPRPVRSPPLPSPPPPTTTSGGHRVLQDVQEEDREFPYPDEQTHRGTDTHSEIHAHPGTETGSGTGEHMVRGVRSLGVWCGASLVGGIKVRGKAEVERERFLSQLAMGHSGLPPGW